MRLFVGSGVVEAGCKAVIGQTGAGRLVPFTMMAKGLIDVAGPDVLRRLWDAFALSDEQLASVLGGRVHPAGQWLGSWNELQGEG